MNDSRTLELWKQGRWLRASARTSMYIAGFFLGNFILALVVGLAGGLLIASPAIDMVLTDECHVMIYNCK